MYVAEKNISEKKTLSPFMEKLMRATKLKKTMDELLEKLMRATKYKKLTYLKKIMELREKQA